MLSKAKSRSSHAPRQFVLKKDGTKGIAWTGAGKFMANPRPVTHSRTTQKEDAAKVLTTIPILKGVEEKASHLHMERANPQKEKAKVQKEKEPIETGLTLFSYVTSAKKIIRRPNAKDTTLSKTRKRTTTSQKGKTDQKCTSLIS